MNESLLNRKHPTKFEGLSLDLYKSVALIAKFSLRVT